MAHSPAFFVRNGALRLPCWLCACLAVSDRCGGARAGSSCRGCACLFAVSGRVGGARVLLPSALCVCSSLGVTVGI